MRRLAHRAAPGDLVLSFQNAPDERIEFDDDFRPECDVEAGGDMIADLDTAVPVRDAPLQLTARCVGVLQRHLAEGNQTILRRLHDLECEVVEDPCNAKTLEKLVLLQKVC